MANKRVNLTAGSSVGASRGKFSGGGRLPLALDAVVFLWLPSWSASANWVQVVQALPPASLGLLVASRKARPLALGVLRL